MWREVLHVKNGVYVIDMFFEESIINDFLSLWMSMKTHTHMTPTKQIFFTCLFINGVKRMFKTEITLDRILSRTYWLIFISAWKKKKRKIPREELIVINQIRIEEIKMSIRQMSPGTRDNPIVIEEYRTDFYSHSCPRKNKRQKSLVFPSSIYMRVCVLFFSLSSLPLFYNFSVDVRRLHHHLRFLRLCWIFAFLSAIIITSIHLFIYIYINQYAFLFAFSYRANKK